MSILLFYWPWFLSVDVAWWKDFGGRYSLYQRQTFFLFLMFNTADSWIVRIWFANQNNHSFLSETSRQWKFCIRMYTCIYRHLIQCTLFDCSLTSEPILGLFFFVISSTYNISFPLSLISAVISSRLICSNSSCFDPLSWDQRYIPYA